MKKTGYLLLIFTFLSYFSAFAVCEPDETTVNVSILTDNYAYETAWRIVGTDGTVYFEVDFDTYENYTQYDEEICMPQDACAIFYIDDSYGDGIFAPGGFSISVNNVEVAAGAAFGSGTSVTFNCGPGEACTSAIPITEGVYAASFDDSWLASFQKRIMDSKYHHKTIYQIHQERLFFLQSLILNSLTLY